MAGNRKTVAHGQKRKMRCDVGTLTNSSTPTLTIDLSKGDLFTATTYSGTAATGIIIDVQDAYNGAEFWINLLSSNSSDDFGSIKFNGDSADTTKSGGSFNDDARMLIHIVCVDVTPGSSLAIIDYTTIA